MFESVPTLLLHCSAIAVATTDLIHISVINFDDKLN